VSLKLPIEEFGVYSIAYSVAIGLLQFSYPVLTATLPRLVEIGADHAVRRRMTLQLMKLIGAIVLVIGVGYILCGRLILGLWLGDPALAVNVSVVLNWLMLSSAMNVVYNVGYINWVSLGETRWIAMINSASFVIALIVTPFCIRAFGLPGAAFSMVTINLIGCVSAMIWFVQGFSRQKRAIR
jgi:O-antigen/teichoic acid export membrane protein